MKIAIISSGYLPVVDGVTVALDQRLRSLSQQGHHVLLLCPDYQPIAPVYPHWQEYVGEIYPGVQVMALPSEPFMGIEFERNLSRQAAAPLRQALRDFHPDLIHVDEPERIFLGLLKYPGIEVARSDRLPCTAFFHTNFIDYIEDFVPLPAPLVGGLRWGSKQIIRRVFNAYDATLVSSDVAHQRIRQMGIRNRVGDRFLGIDLAQFQAQARLPQFFFQHYGIVGLEEKTKVVFLGRLTPDKGWRFTLDALTTLVRQPQWGNLRHTVSLIIAGDGELREEILRTLGQLGIETHWLGRVPPTAVPPLLVNCDLHVTTSTKETLGLTVLEAFAAGIPAIAPRAGGVTTTLQDGWNGFLFEPQSKQDFLKKLLKLIQNSNLRREMGDRARRDAAQYGQDAAVERLLAVWQAQIDRCRPQSASRS